MKDKKPSKTKVNVRIPAGLKEELTREAARRGISVPSLCETIVRKYS